MTNTDRPRDLMGGPQADEERTDILGGPDPEVPLMDTMGGPRPNPPGTDVMGGAEPVADPLGDPQAETDVFRRPPER